MSIRFLPLRFMNIAVDETNIVPYEVYRRYISGSARASLAISGDVIGPIFPDGEAAMLRYELWNMMKENLVSPLETARST